MKDVNQTKGTGRAWLENSTGLLSHLALAGLPPLTCSPLELVSGTHLMCNLIFKCACWKQMYMLLPIGRTFRI